MNSIIAYAPLLLQGIFITLAAWMSSAAISLLIGTLFGILSSPYVGSYKLISCIKVYTFITKGIPAYVQILIFYFAIPSFLNVQVSGFVAATIALALCSSGYVTEIIRSAINSVPSGQWDACFVLGYSLPQSVVRIIFPQALRVAIPALIGELGQILQSTSLFATIGVVEITRAGMNIISRELNPLPVYLTIASIYLVFSAFLTLVMIYAERRSRYDSR